MIEDLQNLVDISERIGNNPKYCNLSGGNTSLKIDGKIFVKASGQLLSDAKKKPIFVEIDLNNSKKVLKKNKLNFSNHINNNLKPSIELLLHQKLPFKFVIHSHPIEILALTILGDISKKILQNIDSFSYIKLPYIEIGEELGKQIYHNYLKTKCNIFILGNHGLVVGHDNPLQAEKIHQQFIDKISIERRKPSKFDEKLIIPFLQKIPNSYLPESEIIHSLAIDPLNFKLCKRNAPYPDHIVFCGKKPLIIESLDQIRDLKISDEKWILIENIGVLLLCDQKVVIQKMLINLVEVYLRVNRNRELYLLSDIECSKISNMEEEKYRINMLKQEKI